MKIEIVKTFLIALQIQKIYYRINSIQDRRGADPLGTVKTAGGRFKKAAEFFDTNYMKERSFLYIGSGDMEKKNSMNETMRFGAVEKEYTSEAEKIILTVIAALEEKGYNPVNQLVGYILSGDPTYITSHKNARSIIRRLERDEILEEIVKDYIGRRS